jgi:hypothetical protein
MADLDIEGQLDRETAIAGLENAARRYAAAFLGIAAGDVSQEQLFAARERLAAAACTYAAAHGGTPSAGRASRAGTTEPGTV